MKKLFFLFLLAAPWCQAQTTARLSEQAEISVLTLGPWEGQVYTAFGHSAFRVHDPQRGIDDAYNYGVFDYDRPNFYLNFARGYNVYKLGVMDYPSFEYTYIYYNRFIHEQVLNLTQDEKQRLFDFLQWNALPENQEYFYDYFYDNCATKIPEVMLRVFGDSVRFDGSYIRQERTIRELTDLYLGDLPWGDLGIDVGLGLPTDKTASAYEHMFLPDYVESGFAHASVFHEGKWEPLVKQTNIIYEAQPVDEPFNYTHPLIIFSLFLVAAVGMSYRDIRKRTLSHWFDVVFFGALGVLGILLLLLWVATNHQAAARNFNLLWALPTHLIAVIAFLRQPRWLEKYFLASFVLTGVLLISWPVLPQKLHYSLIPLVSASGLRAFIQYHIRRRVR